MLPDVVFFSPKAPFYWAESCAFAKFQFIDSVIYNLYIIDSNIYGLYDMQIPR